MKETNSAVLGKLLSKVKKHVVSVHLYEVFRKVGTKMIEVAIENSTNSEDGTNSLTGNTKYGYVVGFFVYGKLRAYLTCFSPSVSNGGRPSIGMVVPGHVYKAFKDIDSGEDVRIVNDYNFLTGFQWQPTQEGRFAWEIAREYLQSYKPKMELEMLMVNGAPYGRYLEDVRELDIMTTVSLEASDILRQNMTKMNLQKVNWKRKPV